MAMRDAQNRRVEARSTLLSTRVPVAARSATTSEGHEFVSCHGHVATSAKALRQSISTRGRVAHLPHDNRVVLCFELDLSPSADAQRISELLGDRDLALLRDSHSKNPTIRLQQTQPAGGSKAIVAVARNARSGSKPPTRATSV